MGSQFELLTHLSEEEKEQLICLFTDSFDMNSEEGKAHFRFFLEDGRFKKYTIVRTEGKIVAVLSLLDKEVHYFGIACKVAGMSYMAIDKTCTDPSVKDMLIEGVFKLVSDDADLMLGFARKKMDGFWYRYGFLGFTNFGKITVECKHISSLDTSLSVAECSTDDVPFLRKLHSASYSNLFLSLERSEEDWQYILARIKRYGPVIETIKDPGEAIVGYIIRNGNIIEELALSSAHYRPFLSLLCRTLKQDGQQVKQLHFQIGITHPLNSFIADQYSHSLETRFAWNGGHIIKINTLARFLERIKPVLQNRLTEAGMADADISIVNVRLIILDGVLKIDVLPQHDDFNITQMLFWQKLVFGVVDAEKLVKDFPISKKEKVILKIMFPFLQPQAPAMDQF
ncbi:MAG: hypothetical protein V4539_10860 [Bacteroidota bacterium]